MDDSFNKLARGLSESDRRVLLDKINKSLSPSVQLVEAEQNPENQNITLKIKFENESIFYKFIIWFRSIIQKKQTNEVYNEEIIARIAKKVNRDHPGLLDHKNFRLDSIFYRRLIALREAGDFFRPYLSYVSVNPGDFYVFLCSFVTPEITDAVNSKVNPFSIPFDEEVGIEKRNDFLRKLDEVLNGMNAVSREKLYDSISAVNWLDKFSRLTFIHFISQFTNLTEDSYTAPYKSVREDYENLAALFCDIDPVNNDILEAIFLYSKKQEIENNDNVQNKDIEKAIKEFLVKANSKLALIQMFISGVPIIKVGKVINANYDWNVNSSNGAEAWFPAFRAQWRKLIDVRWNDWLRERKKSALSSNLKDDFGLEEFPTLKYRPWANLWLRIPFSQELTAGFLSWFVEDMYEKVIPVMNEVMLEGVFYKNENRDEYSEALNNFVQACKQIQELDVRLSPDGDLGSIFEDFETNKIRTLQIQNQIETMVSETENVVRDSVNKFTKSCQTIDLVYRGFFSDVKDSMHEGLQNWGSIKGHQNREWKDKLYNISLIIKKCIYYIAELEPIDAATKDI